MSIYLQEMSPLRFLKKVLGEFVFDVYMLSDSTKRIPYITSTGVDPYFAERVCGKEVTITKIKRIYVWELKKFVDGQDAVLVDMHKFFAYLFNFDGGFLVPPFVRQVLDVDIKDAIKINSKNLKKVYKFSYDVHDDPNMLKYFYEKMHVPYIKKRYGDSAYIEDFDTIEKMFKNGELLFIKLNDEYVSAQLTEIDGDKCFLRKNGVLDESFIEEGALVATYYFAIHRAKDINLKFVDFGQSRPFLSDGVLRHKSLWGTRICEDDTTRKRIIYSKNIFEQPFICIEDKKLKAIVFSENDKLINEYTRSGLEFKVIDI